MSSVVALLASDPMSMSTTARLQVVRWAFQLKELKLSQETMLVGTSLWQQVIFHGAGDVVLMLRAVFTHLELTILEVLVLDNPTD